MQLIHHSTDMFVGDVLASSPVHSEKIDFLDLETLPEIEYEVEATDVQKSICDEAIHWRSSEIGTPKANRSLQSVLNAWKALASYYSCLRAYLKRDPITGRTTIRILRRIENIALLGEDGEYAEDKLAHITLAAAADNNVKLCLHFHRALVDATTLGMILTDFDLLLAGFPPLERTGFTAYTRYLTQSKSRNDGLDFWKKCLGESTSKSTLLSQAATPSPQSANTRKSITAIVKGHHSNDGLELSKTMGCSRRTLLELFWAAVLRQHTESSEVLFGTVGRDLGFVAADSCAGCLDQTYIVRLSTSDTDSVKDVVNALDSFHAVGSGSAFVGFNQIRNCLPAQTRVDSAVSYVRGSNPQCLSAGLKQFPIVLTIGDTGSLNVTLNYADHVSQAQAEFLLQHYVSAIQGSMSMPGFRESKFGAINLVSAKERQMLLQGPTVQPLESPPTLPELIEAAIARYPTRIAVDFDGETILTYRQLNAMANGLARTLRLRRGEIVCLLMDRSANLVIALLAVLKSGASYTILSGDAPSERNSVVIQECRATTILADDRYLSTVHGARSITECLSQGSKMETQDNVWHRQERPVPEDRCYIIYTSGSTGKPKGTVITHQAAVSGILCHFSIEKMPRCLLFYAPTASAAQRVFLSTLIHGGTIVLTTKEKLAADLGDVVNRLKVDAMEITPTALAVLQPSDMPHIKLLTIAGERIPEALVDTWAERKSLLVRNRYGSSECTQMSLGRRMMPGENPKLLSVPQDTTTAYILKSGTADVAPIGVSGELCLAGPQLSSGYLDEPRLTDAAFVPNPFGTGRLYRTGDKARRNFDGSIEIMGRIDWQAKINGNKVEPEDVDHALGNHQDVAACVTFAVEIDDRLALVTCIVLHENLAWSLSLPSIRKYAIDNLPRFMVPSFWLPSQELPRNTNGKVDLKMLRQTSKDLGAAGFAKLVNFDEEIQPPATDVEIQVAKIWAQVLGLEEDMIGRYHSFLGLGGNSIMAITAASKLRQNGLQIDFADLVSDMSLEAVADSVSASVVLTEDSEIAFSLLDDSNEFFSHIGDKFSMSDAYPATPLQAGLLSTLNNPGDPYSYRWIWNVEGADVPKLKSSFEQVFESSDVLRTGFIAYKKSFVQIVRDDVHLPWLQSNDSLQSYLENDSQAELPMSGPLIRIGYVDQKYLVVTMHHSLCDHWSNKLIYQDVASVYFGGELKPRPKFQNFIQHLAGLESNIAQEFWATHLEGLPRSCINFAPTNEISKISQRLSINLEHQTKSLGVTLGPLVYSAWAIVLSQHLGTSNVGFLTSISGREISLDDVQHICGPTMTTAPQSVHVNPEQSLASFASSVSAGFRQVAKFSHVGVREALRAADIHPGSLDTLVNVLMRTEEPQDVSKLFKRHGERTTWSSPYTVLEIESENAETLNISMVSSMESQRLQFLLDSFVKTLTTFMQRPDEPIKSVNVISDAEELFLSQTLSNVVNFKQPQPSMLHSAFEGYAQSSPEAVAIDWDSYQQVTFAELDKRANQMAHLLIGRGVRPGDAIAIMLEKSVNALVSILGVMKAGAAYVPLSSENPDDRNTFIIDHSAVKLLVTEPGKGEFAGEIPHLEVLLLQNSPLLEQLTTPPTTSATPDNLAYILYTSGSTGQPKGIMVPHRSAAAAVESMIAAEGRRQGEWRSLQFANFIFDASVQDIFNTLSSGGTLCMAPTEKLLSDLRGCINEMRVKQAIITPTVASLLQPEDVPGFETLIVGGEPITDQVINTWRPHCRILNVYGPTETCMVVTTKDVQLDSRVASIGKPFPTVMAYVVEHRPDAAKSEDVNLVPYGTVGELCISGPQVSDGYVKRGDLTAAAFITSASLGGIRLYRTGDLVRWLPGGELECLGRTDNQVSIHGYRVELGEVERAVRNTGLVHDTAVMVANINSKPQLVSFCIFHDNTRTNGANDAVLANVIQSAEGHKSNFQSLKEKLNTLPPYMLPKLIIPMGSFPKLPSKKVDRKALKALFSTLEPAALYPYVLDTAGEEHKLSKPQTPMEETLEVLWSTILSIPKEKIGRLAHFLSLGGDSISAISLASLARQNGFDLSVSNILKHARLKDMVQMMMPISKTETRNNRVFNVPESAKILASQAGLNWDADVDYAYPCPPGQAEFLKQGARDEQMWVLQTVRRMPADVDQAQWIEATSKLVEANDILRTSWVNVQETGWIGVVLRSSQLSLIRATCRGEDEASAIAERMWSKRFVFGEPFIKFAMLTFPDGSWDLVIKMDHAVYDGTLLRVFDAHFGAVLRGERIPTHTEFSDFSSYIFNCDKSKSLKYYVDRLLSAKAALTDTSRPSWLTAKAPRITQSVRRSLPTPEIDRMSKELGIVPSAIFQSAFQLWLSWITKSKTIGFDYLLSSRNLAALPDPQSINGTVANFLPVFASIKNEEPMTRLLAETQDDFWTVTEHIDVGLDDIYHAAGLDRGQVGNRVLFLFQPFEKAASDDPNDKFRWLVMAKSKVRMYQPYSIVVEVSRGFGHDHNLSVFYDDLLFTRDQVTAFSEQIASVVTTIITSYATNESLSTAQILSLLS